MRILNGQLVKFTASDGLELDGFIARGPKKTKTLLIHVHGMTGDFPSYRLHWIITETMHKIGIDTFLINTRGKSWYSWFHKGNKELIIGTCKERFEDSEKDIDAAIRAAKRLSYKKIILSGHSTGCQKITYYQSRAQDKNVAALVLLAPADDYSVTHKEMGRRFAKAVKLAKSMVRRGKGSEQMPSWVTKSTAKRFLSYADPKNVEAQVFNYDGELKHFQRVRCPVVAVFGSREEYKDRPVTRYGEILKSKTRSKNFNFVVIKGGDHGFKGHERGTIEKVAEWLKTIV